ncbi:MAG TPA: type IV toxin-antitoxin system AbiEi family antitoxin domain-containing protein [Acidimicrobiales bacterium]|nr:type IV toxin-antitoxin system AbiEi family antitoxin domain-containing protein [Acidimicrobiales bacterium]
MSSPAAALAALFRSQHGVAATTQLHALGVNRGMIARRVGRGDWTRVGRRVVRLAGTPATWETQLLAHVLAAGAGAVASHRSAAALWGLDGCRKGGPEVTIPFGRNHSAAGARIHRIRDLDRVQPVRRAGIPTTPIERTLLDLGAVATKGVVLIAVDDARRKDLTDWDRLLDCLVLHARRGRDGVGTFRSILDDHFGELAVTGSAFERLVYAFLCEAGLPQPVLQHEVCVDGRDYRFDLAYPEQRVGIELDGTIHLRRDVWEKDHERQNALVLAGWTVLRFTWRDYQERRLDLVREVRAALKAAA